MSLFAKVGLDLRDHHRAHAAGEAMATWTWMLLYSRAGMLDGFVPYVAIRGAWVGEKAARVHAEKLVKLGLLEHDDERGGYWISRYAEWNETRADVDKRRKETRDRVRLHREKQDGNSLLTSEKRVTNAFVPDSDSDSDSDSDLREESAERGEAEKGTWVAAVEVSPGVVTMPMPGRGDGTFKARLPPKRGSQLPEDWAPSATTVEIGRRLAGCEPLELVPAFTDHHRAKGSVMRDWEAAFRTWCRNHRRYGQARGRIVQQAPTSGPAYDEKSNLPEAFRE